MREMHEWITPEVLGRWAWRVEECYYRNADSWNNVYQHVEDVLAYYAVPEEWHGPVKVLAQGACGYYGQDDWAERFMR